jgi:hypothetical protein
MSNLFDLNSCVLKYKEKLTGPNLKWCVNDSNYIQIFRALGPDPHIFVLVKEITLLGNEDLRTFESPENFEPKRSEGFGKIYLDIQAHKFVYSTVRGNTLRILYNAGCNQLYSGLISVIGFVDISINVEEYPYPNDERFLIRISPSKRRTFFNKL